MNSEQPLYPGQREHFKDIPRLPPGKRVSYTPYAGQKPYVGVTVPINGTKYEPYPPGHPWALPDYATPVRWDNDDSYSVTWVRSCCLTILPPSTKQSRDTTAVQGSQLSLGL